MRWQPWCVSLCFFFAPSQLTGHGRGCPQNARLTTVSKDLEASTAEVKRRKSAEVKLKAEAERENALATQQSVRARARARA